MRGFLAALGLLTRLPLPARYAAHEHQAEHAAIWFPAVGLLIGALLALVAFCAGRLDTWLAALLTLLAWVWVTGALHLDGLADTFDALGAGHGDRRRLLLVLADPHVGSFGVVAIVLLIAAKLVLLAGVVRLDVSLHALLLVPAWARLGALWWGSSLPSIKPGLGARFAWRGPSWSMHIWWVVLVLASLPFPGLWLAPLVLAGWRIYIRKGFGGVCGDCLGAGIEVTEGLLLLGLVMGAGVNT